MVYEEFSASMSEDFMNNIKRLKGGMNKQKVKISPDLTTSGPNNITTFRLPLSSLIDFNSISMCLPLSVAVLKPSYLRDTLHLLLKD